VCLETHDAMRAYARACVDRWNAGRWQRARIELEPHPVTGEGRLTVVVDGTRQGTRYHLPEEEDDIRQAIFALCEDPVQWKSQHTRDFGKG